MPMQWAVRLVLAGGILLAGTAWPGHPCRGDDSADTPETRALRLLDAVATGVELDPNAAELLPELIELLDSAIPYESTMALRALARIGPDAAPAVEALCRKLDDADHARRSLAVDALVAIGDASIEPLRETLSSESGRSRAAAAFALHRLGALTIDEVTALADDADPRVRAAAAQALADFGEPGVAPLARLFADTEIAVAVQAAESLIVNHADAATALPVLIESITRPDVAWYAANAIGAYGVDAQRAIPALIENFPPERDFEDYWANRRLHYNAGYALSHIGPPHVDDLPALIKLLSDEDCEKRILAIEAITLLGADAASAADALEAAIFDSLAREREEQREAALHSDDEGYMSERWPVPAEDALAALWHVTHDAPRFINALERHAVESEVGLYFYDFSAFDDGFTAEDVLLLEPLLRSENIHVRKTALTSVSHLAKIALPLKEALIDLASTDDGRLTTEIATALRSIGPSAAEDTGPLLVDLVRDHHLELIEFAYAIQSVEYGGEGVEELLLLGIEEGDEYTARECATAMIAIAGDTEADAMRISELPRLNRKIDLAVAEGLSKFQSSPDFVVQCLVAWLTHRDHWTRHAVAQSLGEFGPAAIEAVDDLALRVNDIEEGTAMRLQAAKAIFLITGDASRFEQTIHLAFHDDRENWENERYQALGTIIELGSQGEPFVQHLIDELHAGDLYYKEDLIDALMEIDTPEAITAIEEAARSTDWMMRGPALDALEQIRNSAESRDE